MGVTASNYAGSRVITRVTNTSTIRRSYFHSSPSLALGFFDDAKSFISGLMVRAEASHILIKGTDAEAERKIQELQKDISNDPDKFAKAAALHSDCPSGRSQGGSLGEFGRYSMVPEFDKVVFNKDCEVGVVHGPIQTSFGYHLILIQRRTNNGEE
jgi:peptidyl-prolyl cis-trans isomerase C